MSLRGRNLGRRLGGRWAIRGCNLDLEEGRWLGILGRNGAGKTTLMRLLATVLTPDEGGLFWRGVPVRQGAALRAYLGYLPQTFALPPLPTVWDALLYLAALKGIPADNQQAACARALRWAEGEGLAERSPDRLSSGMLRRAGLAQAVLGRPSVLVLDEPDAVADPSYRRLMADRLRDLVDGGCAVVTAANDPAFLEAADAVLLLDRGGSRGMYGFGAFRGAAEGGVWSAPGDTGHHAAGPPLREAVSAPANLEDAFTLWRMKQKG